MAMRDLIERKIDFWHWGDSEDFVDIDQEMHWYGIVRDLGGHSLEEGSPEDGDPRAILAFLTDQTKPILPGLARIIARLLAGEAFPRPDGWRLAPPQFDRGRGRAPTPNTWEKMHRAAQQAMTAMDQGKGRDKTIKEAAVAFGLTPAQVREAVKWLSEE